MPKFDGMVGIPEKGVNFGGHPNVQESWYLPLKKTLKLFLKIETSKNLYLSKENNLSVKNYHEGRWVASQTEWLKNTRGRVSLDFIGRFENLQEDFDSICDKIGKKKIKLLEAKKLNKRPHYSSFYDDESMGIIERLYKDDIKRFNYEYEEAPVQVCDKSFDTERQLHAHLKAHKMRMAEYYQTYYPRHDKHDGKI